MAFKHNRTVQQNGSCTELLALGVDELCATERLPELVQTTTCTRNSDERTHASRLGPDEV